MVHYIKRVIFSIGLESKNLWYFLIMSKIGGWFKKNRPFQIFIGRTDLYKFANSSFQEPLLYLEFGVYKGDSIRNWVEINNNPKSQFYGFDTFLGLPHDWKRLGGDLKKGSFNVGGNIPDISDDRVKFFKGLFQDTLPSFVETQDVFKEKRLLIHLDADLYSSTLYVLCTLNSFIKPGTIIVFDEFTSGDEYMAFENYLSAFQRNYRVVAVAGKSYQQVMVEIIQ